MGTLPRLLREIRMKFQLFAGGVSELPKVDIAHVELLYHLQMQSGLEWLNLIHARICPPHHGRGGATTAVVSSILTPVMS